MTDELKGMLNDPKVAVQVALGDPAPALVPQQRGSGLELDKVYFSEPKRFVLKKAHLARDDVRIFDTEGHLVANSHHPGKNPYDALDPLGLSNAVRTHARPPSRAAWKCLTDRLTACRTRDTTWPAASGRVYAT
eukprot:IDg8167t1